LTKKTKNGTIHAMSNQRSFLLNWPGTLI
jgi:hypothetical protein